jgi:hypothetical protein
VLRKLRIAGPLITCLRLLLLLLVGWHVALHTLAPLQMLVWCFIVSMLHRACTAWAFAGWRLACRPLLLLLWLLLSLWRLLLPLLLLRRLSWLQRLPAAACTTTLPCLLLLLLFAAAVARASRCCTLATWCWA